MEIFPTHDMRYQWKLTLWSPIRASTHVDEREYELLNPEINSHVVLWMPKGGDWQQID